MGSRAITCWAWRRCCRQVRSFAAAAGYGMAYFPALADAARAVSRVLASGVLPVTLEFLDQVCIGAVEDYAQIGLDTSAGALLIFGQDGNPAVIARDLERMAQASR